MSFGPEREQSSACIICAYIMNMAPHLSRNQFTQYPLLPDRSCLIGQCTQSLSGCILQLAFALQAYEENVQELNRLRWICETSQMQHITTLAWQAKQEAMLQSAQHSSQLSIDRAGADQVWPWAEAW